MTSFGMALFLTIWLMGIVCTFEGFRSQDSMFFIMGLVFLIPAILWTRSLVLGPKREAEAKRKQKLAEQTLREKEEESLSNLEGLAKYNQMDEAAARRYQEGIKAMYQLGMIMQQSVSQKQEKDWAFLGGVASGIAGPVAGVVTAANAMMDNEQIRAENAAARAWGAKQNAFYQDLARQAQRESPVALSMEELKKKYVAIFSWAPATLFSLLSLSDIKTEIDEVTGAVIVSANWKQADNSICIDGTLRAKLYTDQGECAGCAYLVLPKSGTVGFRGYLSGICVSPKPSAQYTVKIEPVDLWELASRDNTTAKRSEQISYYQHRKLVADGKRRFQAELGQ